ncbi:MULTISPECIES: hypothetical protein [Halorussus]|uniref:DUF7312 domain-containing protein n=1 Tax=Halorussus TaxID=1070314 RepID=UPI000E218431|nr:MULTISPECIES: hypothetical protein [Halorussus]NHN57777.1 hypothetical protein [Halorussus sp. JP-T4]
MSDWKYDIDEVGHDAEEPDDEAGVAGAEEGERPALQPVEPGSPTAENALFVALGIGATLFVFARVVMFVG